MSNVFKSWLSASRPKTLALAIAGPLTGISLALFENSSINPFQAVLCILVAMLLQILSNFSNDLGDFKKGTDQLANRTDRALANGDIKESQMKAAIVITALLSLVAGISLIWYTDLTPTDQWILFLIGLAAIGSAIAYTMGKRAYGYNGFGDIFVFVFFGLASVLVTYYIQMRTLSWEAILGAIAIGSFSTMVLNINNVRDIKKDAENNKRTIPVIIGFVNSRIYQIILAAIGSFCWIVLILTYNSPYLAIPLFLLVLVLHAFMNLKQDEFMEYNKQLKYISLLTMLLSIILFISAVIFATSS
jgi:1,4-dihydroxy-2-naphthoate octaprenyltransferase